MEANITRCHRKDAHERSDGPDGPSLGFLRAWRPARTPQLAEGSTFSFFVAMGGVSDDRWLDQDEWHGAFYISLMGDTPPADGE